MNLLEFWLSIKLVQENIKKNMDPVKGKVTGNLK